MLRRRWEEGLKGPGMGGRIGGVQMKEPGVPNASMGTRQRTVQVAQ